MFSQKTATQQSDDKHPIREQGNAGKSMPSVTIQKMAVPSNDNVEEREEQSKPFQLRAVGAYQPNNTGLPDQLKTGIEGISGYSMDDVKVHYNSDKPAQLQALAYAQGSDIHIGPGQEQHLPHEAWHVVQQKQGRVQPTIQRKDNWQINDDAGLEREADVMGLRSLGHESSAKPLQKRSVNNPPVQLFWGNIRDAVGAVGLAGGAYYGATLGTAFGPLGTALGGLVGGVAGGLLGYKGVNAVRDHTVGPPSNSTTQSTLGPFDHTTSRLPKLEGAEGDRLMMLLPLPIQAALEKGEPGAIVRANDHFKQHFGAQIANPGDHERADPSKPVLTEILLDTEYIKMILKGGLHKQPDRGQSSASSSGGSAVTGNLKYKGDNAPVHAKEAQIMFNKLVSTPVTSVGINKNKIDPVSAMGVEASLIPQKMPGQLHVGTVATRGILLHELGHHLENNLSYLDFATLHNFLRARSKGNTMRKVGYQPLLGRESSEIGYNTENPDLQMPGSPSLLKTGMAAIPNTWGNEAAGNVINRFVMDNSSTDQTSYHSLSDRSGGTEFLSTTIHFFSDPTAAFNLVRKDPFRVAFFIMMANKPVYEEIKAAFTQKTRIDLDTLLHKIG